MPIRRTRHSRSWKVSGDLNTVGQHQAYVDLTSKLYCVPKYSKPGNSSSQVAKQICRDRRECTRGYSDCVGLIKGVEGHQSRFESKKESSLDANFLRPFRLDLVRGNLSPSFGLLKFTPVHFSASIHREHVSDSTPRQYLPWRSDRRLRAYVRVHQVPTPFTMLQSTSHLH